MYIRNGQSISSISKPVFENISRIPGISEIADISEMESANAKRVESAESPAYSGKDGDSAPFQKTHNNDNSSVSENFDINILNRPENQYKKRKKIKTRSQRRSIKKEAAVGNADIKTGRFAEYLYNRKYYILLFSVLYITGLIIGAALVKSIDSEKIVELRNAVDNYFTDISYSDIPARIINGIAADGVILFIAYLSGVTVFAPLVCSAICIYKGLSCGYIIGVYISGGADLFHIGVCCLTFIFYILAMLCIILMCGESMGLSVFLLKSGESFRRNLSFRNIAIYSFRYTLFLILMLAFAAAQAIALTFVYSVYL